MSVHTVPAYHHHPERRWWRRRHGWTVDAWRGDTRIERRTGHTWTYEGAASATRRNAAELRAKHGGAR